MTPLYLFTASSLIFGMLLVFAHQPLSNYDAPSHYFRGLQVSQGTLFSERVGSNTLGEKLPRGHIHFVKWAWESYYGQLKRPSHSEIRLAAKKYSLERQAPAEFVGFTNSGVYSPVNYLPQAAGFAVGRLLHLEILPTYLLVCTFNLWGYILLFALSIALVPKMGPILALFGLFPLSLFSAASESADALNLSFPFFYIALLFHFRNLKIKMTFRWGLIFALASAGLALLKPNNGPLLAVLFLIPRESFLSKWKWFFFVAGFFLLGSGTLCLWNQAVKINVAGWLGQKGNSPEEQLKLFLQYPFSVLASCLSSFFAELYDQWQCLYALIPMFLYQSVRNELFWASQICLVVVTGFLFLQPLFTRRESLYLGCVGIAFGIGTYFLLWAAWDTVGIKTRIVGVQGRYLVVGIFLFLNGIRLLSPLAVETSAKIRKPIQRLFYLGYAANVASLCLILYHAIKWPR